MIKGKIFYNFKQRIIQSNNHPYLQNQTLTFFLAAYIVAFVLHFFWRQFVFNIHSLQSRQLKLPALRYNKYFKLTLEGQHLISTGVFNFFIHFVRDKERRGN